MILSLSEEELVFVQKLLDEHDDAISYTKDNIIRDRSLTDMGDLLCIAASIEEDLIVLNSLKKKVNMNNGS